jgi:hypothetical protein
MSVTYHWNKKLKLKKVFGIPNSEWGVAFIILSDYMNFGDDRSKTVISTCLTFRDVKSKVTNKTVEETIDQKEIASEILRQLKYSYKDLPEPTHAIINPTDDTAFISTNDNTYLKFKSEKYNNLYTLGCHNGKSIIAFTSIEGAVTNALKLAHVLEPKSKKKYKIKGPFTLTKLLWIILIIIIILAVIYNKNK